jgi:hypothetical protein
MALEEQKGLLSGKDERSIELASVLTGMRAQSEPTAETILANGVIALIQ